MSLYQCDKCGCIENTATANFWFRNDKGSACKGAKLCSACDPDINKWHGQFKRMYLPRGQFVKDAQGNLEHKDTKESPYEKYVSDKEYP